MSDGQQHSPIGASSMHRWSICPGSVKLSQGMPNHSSAYAAEGTKAHEVAEFYLTNFGWPNDVDPEMRGHVKVYIDAVLADRQKTDHPDDELLVEHKFDLSSVYPGLFGTSDAVLYQPDRDLLTVYDYKHGAGVPVEVFENPQMMYYGLGALLTCGYTVSEVELVIVQPRCFHPDGPIRRWRFSAVDLIDFAADLVEYATATDEPNARLVPGDHCRWCPAAPKCPALGAQAQETAKQVFSPGEPYDPAKLAETLDWLPVLEAWVKNVREFAYQEAEHGRVAPGYKLVEKRATRKWPEDVDLRKLMLAAGLPKKAIVEEKLKTPAQIEAIAKKEGELNPDAFDALVVKESSGLTLVHESDKREAVKADPKSVFDEVA